MKTSKNTVLVTGGGTGIGLAIAEALIENDNEVIICGRRREVLKAVQQRYPKMTVKVCDVSKERSRESLVEWLLAEHRGLNMLVNNAGIQRPVNFLKGDKDMKMADEEIATNVTAPIHLSGMLIPHLRRKKEAAIVNISSGLAFTPLAFVPVYCATKAAMHSWSLSMRHQLRDTSVRVFEIFPPIVATELGKGHRDPAVNTHAMKPDEVARGFMEALETDQYELAVGQAENLRQQREAFFETMNSR